MNNEVMETMFPGYEHMHVNSWHENARAPQIVLDYNERVFSLELFRERDGSFKVIVFQGNEQVAELPVGTNAEKVSVVWDTEDVDGEVDLPDYVFVPHDISDEDIADYLSDQYGFLVSSYSFVPETPFPSADELARIKAFAEENFCKDPAEQLTVDIDDVAVSNPWMDRSARFHLSDAEAIREWGANGVSRFCRAVRDVLH